MLINKERIMHTWLIKAFVAMLLLVPMFILTPVLEKSFGIRPEATFIWCVGSAVLGVFFWITCSGQSHLLALSAPAIATALYGLTLAAVGNVLLFQSVSNAPNPGVAVAVLNSNAVVIYLVVIALSAFLPRYFSAGQVSWRHLSGVLLVTVGIALISIRK